MRLVNVINLSCQNRPAASVAPSKGGGLAYHSPPSEAWMKAGVVLRLMTLNLNSCKQMELGFHSVKIVNIRNDKLV